MVNWERKEESLPLSAGNSKLCILDKVTIRANSSSWTLSLNKVRPRIIFGGKKSTRFIFSFCNSMWWHFLPTVRPVWTWTRDGRHVPVEMAEQFSWHRHERWERSLSLHGCAAGSSNLDSRPEKSFKCGIKDKREPQKSSVPVTKWVQGFRPRRCSWCICPWGCGNGGRDCWEQTCVHLCQYKLKKSRITVELCKMEKIFSFF